MELSFLFFLFLFSTLFFLFKSKSKPKPIDQQKVLEETLKREQNWSLLSKFQTDLTRWKLEIDKGRQVWKYHSNESPQQRVADKYFLGLDISKEVPNLPKPKTAREAAKNGVRFYSSLQMEDGHWGNDYGGPMFLLPGLIFTYYISNTPFSEEQRIEMARYIIKEQNEDGGWGL